MAISQSEMLTPKEVTKHLNIPLYTLNQLVKNGKLKRYKLGSKTVRFKIEDVDQCLTSILPTGGGEICNK